MERRLRSGQRPGCCASRSSAVRQSAAGAGARGLQALSPLKSRNGARCRHPRRARADRRHLFRRRTSEAHSASDLCSYTRAEIERIAHVAFRSAGHRRNKVTSVDKANVLATSKLWREHGERGRGLSGGRARPSLRRRVRRWSLITNPRRFDVILTENMFGDILSDELSVIGGSIGLTRLGERRARAVRRVRAHPRIGAGDCGATVANPAGAIASAVMMLDEGD
jgi:3-isopropylmalate dehydrogenase